jgi:predicted ester cyclase
MGTEENKMLVRRQFDEIWNGANWATVLHGFDLRIERQIAEGDMVETHWSLRGTHGGPLEGTAPTGKSVYVDGQLLSRIVDGKFVEEWVHWDTLGLLRQIGAVPPPRP